jgi:ketosteroid isomerase-like protein
MIKKILLFGLLVTLFIQCKPKTNNSLSQEEMLALVKSLDAQFSLGTQQKDSALLTNIYSDDSRYVQPNREILVGRKEIGKDWGEFLRLKERPIDLVLNISSVRGNREVIYEVGTGYTLIADSTKWKFNYVNVWKLGEDGKYTLEVDTYNSRQKLPD